MQVKFLKAVDVSQVYTWRCGDGCCVYPFNEPYTTEIDEVMEVSDWHGVTEGSIEGLTEGEDYTVEPYFD